MNKKFCWTLTTLSLLLLLTIFGSCASNRDRGPVPLRVSPQDADIFYQSGMVHFEAGDYARAIYDFETALIYYPDHEASIESLAIARELHIESEREPENSEEFFRRGEQHFLASDYQNAIIYYTEALSLNPDYTDALVRRGAAFFHLSVFENAINDLSHAILLDSANAEAFYNRGITYFVMDNYQNALVDLNRAIELNPFNAEAYHSRAMLYFTTGDYERSVEDFEAYINFNPHDTDALMLLDLVRSLI